MKALYFISIISFLLSCSETNKNNHDNIQSDKNNSENDITPLLEIGSYFTYELDKDKFIGLLLAGIRKEEDSVYYSFFLSGKFFNANPNIVDFQKAGLCGLIIPSYPAGNEMTSFCNYAISETHLKPLIKNLKSIGKIDFSQENKSGSHMIIKKFHDLADEFTMFQKRNQEAEEMIKSTGIPSSKYSILNWNQINIADDPSKLSRPETVWILSPKTAHSAASAVMTEDWWWNPADDLSPFGNDDGADAFYFFKEWRKEHPKAEPATFFSELQQNWQMSFSHMDKENEDDLPSIEKENQFYRNIDRAIMGVAFGQIILEGKISLRLKELGIKSIKRTKTEFGMHGMTAGNKSEYSSRLNKMKNILSKF